MKYIKKLLLKFVPLMPLSLYVYIREKRLYAPNRFLGGYIDFKNNKVLGNTFDIKPNYSEVIDILGFGYSGSGAVLDMFAECDNCHCVGYSDKSSYDNVHFTYNYETDFARLSGGIFEIEKYIGHNNYFHNDALLNRFILCVENFVPFRNNISVRNCFYEFFDEIVEFEMLRIPGNPFNNFLYPQKQSSCIFFLKIMTLEEYRMIANSFLNKLFNLLNKDKSDILVFDHIFGDGEIEIDKKKEYINRYKPIYVYRDPRDVYCFAVEQNITWIAHDTVEDFIQWFKIVTRGFNIMNTQDMLIVQFEKLVYDYDNETDRIFKYVCTTSDIHNKSKKYKYFKPDFSKRNIGIWKKSTAIPKVDFDKIYDIFSSYCFLK